MEDQGINKNVVRDQESWPHEDTALPGLDAVMDRLEASNLASSNPFPFKTPSGDMIVDELCGCGAPRSQHEDAHLSYGHGPCSATNCEKFIWASFVRGDANEVGTLAEETQKLAEAIKDSASGFQPPEGSGTHLVEFAETFGATINPDVTELMEAIDAVERATEFIPGFGLVDVETGELLEVDGDVPEKVAKAFGSNDFAENFGESEVDWVLKKVFKLDGDIVAAEARLKAEVDAIQKNWKPEINKVKRAKDSFIRWVSPLAQRYAEAQLLIRNTKKGGGLKANLEKSIKFPNGTLAFRKKAGTPEKVQLKEGKTQFDAVEWSRMGFTGGYVVFPHPYVDLDKFTEEDRAKLKSGTFDLAHDCPFEVVEAIPPVDEFSISTGVK